MRFALSYEIPVPRPWNPDSETVAYRNTIEQAVAGERLGWDAFWTGMLDLLTLQTIELMGTEVIPQFR